MQVNDYMHRGVQTVSPSTAVSAIAKTMRDGDIGAVPVIENGSVVGMITDRDVAVRALVDGRDVGALTARDIMTTGVACCRESDALAEAVETMEQRQVRRLPVLDAYGNAVGMLSLGDVVHAHRSDLGEAVARSVTGHHG